MTSWPRLTEKCFCNSFPLQRRESTDTRRICWNGKIRKLEKAFRPVFDLSCFSFQREAFMKWVFDPWTKPLSSLSCVFSWLSTKGYYRGWNGAHYTNTHSFYSFCSVLSCFFSLDDVYLLVSLAMCESALNVSVEFRIRGQIVLTELSTCLSTGWITAFHIDLSWAKSTAIVCSSKSTLLEIAIAVLQHNK